MAKAFRGTVRHGLPCRCHPVSGDRRNSTVPCAARRFVRVSPACRRHFLHEVRLRSTLKASFLFVALIVTCHPRQANANGSVVGNGGDGFTDGHRVYVKDLWLAGAYQSPSLPTEIDPTLPFEKIRPAMSAIGVDNTLLPATLTNLDVLFPGLADLTIALIDSYHWQLVDDLPELREPRTPHFDLAAPAPGARIQLAVRERGSIKLSRAWWARMDSFDRAGLILHEALTSLLPTSCVGATCFQNQMFLRHAIGSLFSLDKVHQAKVDDSARRVLKGELETSLGINLTSLEWDLRGVDTHGVLFSQRFASLRSDTARSATSFLLRPPGINLSRVYYMDFMSNVLDGRKVTRRRANTADPMKCLNDETLSACIVAYRYLNIDWSQRDARP